VADDSVALASLGGWSGILERLIKGGRLTAEEATVAMKDVLAGNVTSAQLAAFLAVIRSRGESIEELVGLSTAMLEAAVSLDIAASLRSRLVDTCGTGGDRSGTINVSTMAALVTAAAGVPVCKHGNRAASSQTGSADVLEELGVVIDVGPDVVVRCIEEVNIGFCLAPRFHPGMKHVGPTRRELGVGTAFNFLGPLINPAKVQRQVIGVSDPSVADLMMGVLRSNGATRAMIVFGHDGLDELTTTTTSTVIELNNDEVVRYDIDPRRFGLSRAEPTALKGGAPRENASRVRSILEGEQSSQSDIVALNAAAALIVGDAAENFSEGVEMARSILRDGQAVVTLDAMAAATRAG
jgi:anthranilate phosphoribosyltransferase